MDTLSNRTGKFGDSSRQTGSFRRSSCQGLNRTGGFCLLSTVVKGYSSDFAGCDGHLGFVVLNRTNGSEGGLTISP